MKYLDLFDLFPESISLVHKGEKEIKNIFSTVVSIFIICGFIVLIGILGQDLYKRTNPNIMFKYAPLATTPFFNFNQNNFFIGAALGDFSRATLPADDTSYEILFRYVDHTIIDGKDIWNVTFLESVPCEETEIHPMFKKFDTEKKVLKNFLCPKNFNITIGGDASEQRESWLDVFVGECGS